MLHEYAIEPESLTQFETCRYILEKMGISNGRYIANFPINWYDTVITACKNDPECMPITQSKIMILVSKVRKSILNRYYRYYDETTDWLSSAEYGHTQQPFHAILSRRNPRNHGCVLCVNEITESAENPLWTVSREKRVTRTTAELLDAASPFLEMAKEIVFVDGHFKPDDTRYQNTTKAFLAAIRDANNPIRRLEYHTRGDRRDDPLAEFNDFRSSCEHNFLGIGPKNIPLKIYRWDQRTGGKRMHARYLLTDIGGLRFEYGMDEAYDVKNGRTGQETDITLLDENLYFDTWNLFKKPEEYFDKSDERCVEIR